MRLEYRIEGLICPSLLSRLIGIFAAQAIMPVEVVAKKRGARLSVLIAHGEALPHDPELYAEKMRAIVTVLSVRVRIQQHPKRQAVATSRRHLVNPTINRASRS